MLVQKCKSAYGLCKGAKVKVTYRVAGGSPGWQVAESVFPTACRYPLIPDIGRVGTASRHSGI